VTSREPAVTRVRVRYADTDQMGVVYYANYLIWFEVGRTELLRLRGWSYREMEASGVTLPVVEAACKYHRPSQYDDELEIRTLGALISPVRVRFDYDIVRCADDARIVSGQTLHAAVNPQGRPCRLPDRLRALFS
jgi:acyl-CoA thioester hydrolase